MKARPPASLLAGTLLLAIAIAFVIGIGLGERGAEDPTEATTVTVTLPAEPAVEDANTATQAAKPAGAPGTKAAAPTRHEEEAERRLALDHPSDGYPVIWVRNGHEVEIRTEPGGGEVVARAGARTEFESPTVFGVIEQRGDWAGITTAKLPNNQLGWIKLDRKRLKAGWTRVSLTIDLSERRAQLKAADEVVKSFVVTVGAPGIETPTGRFAVTDTFRGDLNSSAYGCCALALSANQPKLPSGWLGGNRIAIHGTSGPLGVAASHGCVRAADSDVDELVDRVALGTPVFIQA